MKKNKAMEYTIPLRMDFVSRRKRAKKAVAKIREFIWKHFRTKDVKISSGVNEKIWQKGIENPPRRLRVFIEDKEGKVRVRLKDEKEEIKKETKEEKKVKKEKVKEKPEKEKMERVKGKPGKKDRGKKVKGKVKDID